MTDVRRATCTLVAALGVCLAAVLQGQQAEPKKPSLSLKATPPVGFTPLRVVVVVDLRDGSDDYADFYCAGVEWDWGDGTISENSSDCDPYEAGKSQIKRRYTIQHVYRRAGAFRVFLHLKQRDRFMGSAATSVQIQEGAGPGN